MAGKVYLFMYDRGGDPCIAGIYSTREAAEAGLRFGDEESKVVEMEVDSPLPVGPAGHSLWYVFDSVRFPEYCSYRVPAFEPYEVGRVSLEDDYYNVTLWAVDEDEAMRLGSELIEQYKAGQAQAG